MRLYPFFYIFSIKFLLSYATATGDVTEQPPTLSLTGEALLSIPADSFSINLEVVTENRDVQIALSENNSRISTILSHLTDDLSVDNKEIQTSHFSIIPIYSAPPKNADEESDKFQGIKAYRISNTILVTSDKFSIIGQLIDAASKSGANSISNLRFTLKNNKEARSKALKLAVTNAIEDAHTLAEGAGVTLKKILLIRLNTSPFPPVYKGLTMRSGIDSSTPIEQGNVEIKASVTVDFEISS